MSSSRQLPVMSLEHGMENGRLRALLFHQEQLDIWHTRRAYPEVIPKLESTWANLTRNDTAWPCPYDIHPNR